MRARILAASLAALIALTGTGAARAADDVSRSIDALKSKATFSVEHIFVDRVTGTVAIAGGTIVTAPNSVVPLSLSAQLTPSEVHTNEADRDDALKSPDFFDAKTYPAWAFVSTKITPVTATSFGVDGTLTIRGIAQPEHLDVTARGDASHPAYHAVGRVDRKAFHMPVTRLDPVIGTMVDVTLDIVTK
jgi:polyisoprenoid-binding protein YceI